MAKRESTGGGSSASALLRGALAAHEKNKKKPARISAKSANASLEAAERLLAVMGYRESNAVRVIEDGAKPEKGKLNRVKIVLIDEGLGNHRNMNYYGPEAIASAAKVYEGKPSFTNHPAVDEEENLPERDLMKQYGFYEGLHVEKLTNKAGKEVDACVGWLNFEDSSIGREMYCKALAALEYQKKFPESGEQYIGWSVLGGGRGDTKEMDPAEDQTGTMTDFSEPVEVNYVSEFLDAESCDAVTRAGRGGRILAVSESAGGTKEDGMITKLKATLKKLQESAKKASGEAKLALEASAKDLKATVTAMEADVEAAAEEGKDPFEVMCAQKEGESDEDHKGRLAKMGKALAAHLSPEKEPKEGEEPEPAAAPADADTQEARRDALKAFAKEAGIPDGGYEEAEFTRLSKLPYKEAKAQIKKDAKMAEASRAETARELDIPVASLRSAPRAANGARESASETGRNSAAFKESFSQEG